MSDPEFILLRKVRKLKKCLGDVEKIDEMIETAEGIIDQNIKGLLYIMTDIDQAPVKDGEIFQAMFSKILENAENY